jgi:serine phosphatase RsbU (regulator of sigma subunit)/ABC-type amino acid transport substrate-binding protein
MTKIIYSIILGAVCLIWFFTPIYAQEKVYRVGLFQDKPLCFQDNDGGLKGIYIDILEHVALQEGWKLKYVYNPSFEKNLESLKKGNIDIMVSIGYSEERAEIFDFTQETVLTNWGEIFVHRDSTLRSIINLADKKVAVMKGNIYYEGNHGLKSTTEQFNLNIKFIETTSYEEVLKLIDEQKVDAGLISVLYGDMHKTEHEVEGTPIVFHPIELRFALPKGRPDNASIIKALDTEMSKMIEDQSSVYYQSQARWLNRTSSTTDYRWLLTGLAIVAGIAILFVTLSFILNRQVRKRTIELVKRNLEIEDLNTNLEFKVQERTLEVIQQKEEIEAKRQALETVNKHMRDSINYARNIQEAILPKQNKITHHIPEHFVFSLPRDIVSGDFHWFAHDEQSGRALLAVADCTGHGVPGAFMSMLGKSSLDYIVHEKSAYRPADILTHLQADVYRALENQAKDGMDIAVCSFDFKKMIVEFSGAQSSLFLVRGGKVTTIKGNKFPIGGSIKHYKAERNYEQHRIELRVDDVIYMSSDGFSDQFGGPDNRKFGARQFREFLERIHHAPMDVQKELFHSEHLKWRSNQKQIDDILVTGVRVLA